MGGDLIDIGGFRALDNPLRAAAFVAWTEAKIVEAGERPGSFQKRCDPREGPRPASYAQKLVTGFEGRHIMAV